MQALAEEPWERWPSASKMAEQLRTGQAAKQQAQQATEDQRLAVDDSSWATDQRRAGRRRKSPFVATWKDRAIGSVGLLVGVVVLFWVLTGGGRQDGDVTAMPTATSTQPVVVVTRTQNPAPPAETSKSPVATSAPPTATSAPPTVTPTPPTPTPQPDAVVNTQNANLRAGPGTNYDRLASYASGTALAVTGKTATGDWLQVQAPDGTTGWMAGSVLQVKADLAQVAVVLAPPTPTPSAIAGMVFVPAGDFTMGSLDGQGYDDERPRHTVYLDAFYIDKTEVTAAQYQRCVEAGACSAANTGGSCTYGVSGKSDHPINCVDWNQAKAYCTWASRRLPTEAEWEKAARGTDALSTRGATRSRIAGA